MRFLLSSRDESSRCAVVAAGRVFCRPVSGILVTALFFLGCLSKPSRCAAAHDDDSKQGGAAAVFQDEPAARRLYDRMIEAMERADSLYYTSGYERKLTGQDLATACTYRVWLKKPNYFRMEARSASGKEHGVLIGDGSNLWVYWPTGRPRWSVDGNSQADEGTRYSSYLTKPAPPGKVSLWHEAVFLGAGMSFPILEPSIFFGYVDSIAEYIDAVRSLGEETVGGETCEKIEVSMMDRQRSWYLWLSRRDHLPRKLEEVTRIRYDSVAHENWSALSVNGDIPSSMFSWKPPADWKEWSLPDAKAGLLKPGSKAPDFELASLDGERIRLSNYRGRTVWLCFWRIGCPPCRKETPLLQALYAKYRDKGFVVLGVNVSDDRQLTLDFLHKVGVDFPNVLDTSQEAENVCVGYGAGAVPTNYLIDENGAVVDAWMGYREGNLATELALVKAGGKLREAVMQEWKTAFANTFELISNAAQRLGK